MTTTLITGGNKGLGYETARRLKEVGHRVIIGARDADRGQRAAEDLGVEWISIDVSSDESVASATTEIRNRFGGVDVLINNAGISGQVTAMDNFDGPEVLTVLDTNTVGIVRRTHAFLPLLRESAAPVIVNVSTGLGSFAVRANQSRSRTRSHRSDTRPARQPSTCSPRSTRSSFPRSVSTQLIPAIRPPTSMDTRVPRPSPRALT